MVAAETTRRATRPRLGEQPTLKDQVARHIREQVLSGELRPGHKIDQDALAGELGVSKLPVREALIVLEGEGLVDNIARRGAFVASLTPEDVLDHYAIYGMVSGLAAERATERLTDDDLAELEDLVGRMADTGDAQEQEELNFLFHKVVHRAGGSRRLNAVLRLLSHTIPARFFEFTTDWPDRANADHREILHALRARDATRSRELVFEHLRAGGEYAVRALESNGFWSDEEEIAE